MLRLVGSPFFAVNGGVITTSNGEGFISTPFLFFSTFFSITQLKEEEIYTSYH